MLTDFWGGLRRDLQVFTHPLQKELKNLQHRELLWNALYKTASYLDGFGKRIPLVPQQPPARQLVAIVREVGGILRSYIDCYDRLSAHGLHHIRWKINHTMLKTRNRVTKILYGEQDTRKIVHFTFYNSTIQPNLCNKYYWKVIGTRTTKFTLPLHFLGKLFQMGCNDIHVTNLLLMLKSAP